MTKDNKISKEISFFLFSNPLRNKKESILTPYSLKTDFIKPKLHNTFKFISHRKIIKESYNHDKD